MSDARTLVLAREAGAAAALAPVAERLRDDGICDVCAVAEERAVEVLARAGLPVLGFPRDPSTEQVAALLTRERVGALLTGTSLWPRRDNRWWSAARTAGVPSVAVVDHWVNPVQRFSDAQPFDCLPDVVAVPDEVAADALARHGMPCERLRVTGQPYFDDLVRRAVGVDRSQARRSLGLDPGRRVVVFASEPQASHYGASDAAELFRGYTEHDALGLLLDALVRVAPDALAVVKLHPLEDPGTFEALAADRGGIDVRVLAACPVPALIAAADAVVGMTSVLLLEAALAGAPTLSVRPHGRDEFPFAHAELMESLTDPAALPAALAALLQRPRGPATADFSAGAVDRVVALVRPSLRPSEVPLP
ncbi:MAG TPA: hypothetical protein VIL49_15000 [Capillimicrobium sp.]|jgi:hypothetical protein